MNFFGSLPSIHSYIEIKEKENLYSFACCVVLKFYKNVQCSEEAQAEINLSVVSKNGQPHLSRSCWVSAAMPHKGGSYSLPLIVFKVTARYFVGLVMLATKPSESVYSSHGFP